MDLKTYVAISKIRENCKPFLSEKVIMYRGSKKDIPLMRKTRRRKMRKPKDTDIRIHKIADKFFMKKFGWKPRTQGVFAVGSRTSAMSYGRPYYFFPIGKFRYVWSPIKSDFFLGTNMMKTELERGNISKVENEMETRVNSYKDSGLRKAAGIDYDTYEVAFDVDNFYLMSTRMILVGELEKHLFSPTFKKEDVVV